MSKITKAIEIARDKQARLFEQQRAGAPEAPEAPNLVYRAKRKSVSPAVLHKNRIVADMRDGAVVDAFRLLRMRILNVMTRDGWNVLGVTSASGQEGKSVIAANLAVSMAREPDTTVLLVDADLRTPSLHHYFGLNIEQGLADYLRSDLPIEQLLIGLGTKERLLFLPGSSGAEASSGLLGSRKMTELIKELKTGSYARYIILDLPPVLDGDATRALSGHLGGVLLVIDEGRTREDQLTRTMEMLDGVNVVGSVLNRSTELNQ